MRHSQLRSFHAVAESGSFTAAAQRCRVSQPTITTQVRGLEKSFAVELFLRRGRRVELTEAGRGLFEITRRMFSQETEALDFLNECRDLRTGHLRVGSVGPYHVTDMLVAFNRRHPGLYVSVSIGNSQETVQDLLDYKTDVAVLAHIDADPRLVAIPYARPEVVVFVNRAHPLAKKARLRLADLDGQPMIVREPGSTTRRAVDAALQKAGIRPRIVMEIGSRESIREAVAKGIGIGTVSEAEFIPDPRLKALRVSDAEIYTYAHVVYLRERQNARLVHAFLSVLPPLLSQEGRRALKAMAA
jgi:LysR family transcriptional regulator, low CO2-responsive transcriptional regulator